MTSPAVDTVVTQDLGVAADALAQGLLVAFPTETVYGLGADAANPDAVARVFSAKGRPAGHPLIVHLARTDQVADWADLDPAQAVAVERLAAAHWPGPLTIIVPSSGRAAPETTGGRPTVGLRIPDHPVARELLARFGGGVAAPSANRFGRVSPTTAAHVHHDLGGLVEVIVDGGPTPIGLESTIVDLVGPEPTLLRPGAISVAQLAETLGRPVVDGRHGPARAPGMLRSHYAPAATVELITADQLAGTEPGPGSGVGVVAPHPVDHQPAWVLPADPAGYAQRLYATLRAADEVGVDRLLIIPPDAGPLLDAVLDRLAKASAPR